MREELECAVQTVACDDVAVWRYPECVSCFYSVEESYYVPRSIEFSNTFSWAIKYPYVAIGHVLDVAGFANVCPLSQECTFWVEDFHAPFGAVADVDEAFSVYCDGVGKGELAIPRSFAAPLCEELEILIKAGYAIIDVAI